MICYHCTVFVDEEEHKRIEKKFDMLSEKELEKVQQRLNLFHCQGEDDMFDEDGFVVICEECFTKAIEEEEKKNEIYR